jgi:hypothetical protein
MRFVNQVSNLDNGYYLVSHLSGEYKSREVHVVHILAHKDTGCIYHKVFSFWEKNHFASL